MKTNKLFQRDFSMVVIGQIISLFGNAILRYALPLYLLNKTHSPALFGLVIACSFVPMILLSPIGGIVADQLNKKNIMVILDFSTAGLIILFSLLLNKVDLVVLLLVILMLLYGIQGAYQPTVQASIPILVNRENIMPANAVINLVGSLSSLIGPVLGGVLFGFWGIQPILHLSIICFTISAIMELFIHIPYEKKENEAGILNMVKADMKESLIFIRVENPVIGKVMSLLMSLVMCAHPLGQAIYGTIFEIFSHKLYLIFFAALLICMMISAIAKYVFELMPRKEV